MAKCEFNVFSFWEGVATKMIKILSLYDGLAELNRVELRYGFLNEVKRGPSLNGEC